MGNPAKPPVERRHPPRALMTFVNPVAKRLVARGRAADQLLVLHYTGRRSGRSFNVPVGYHVVDGVPTVFTNSRWRHNFARGRDVEVTWRGRRHRARAVLLDDPDVVAATYDDLIRQVGWQRAQRRLGIAINVGRQPTRDELSEAARASGLCLVKLEGLPIPPS